MNGGSTTSVKSLPRFHGKLGVCVPLIALSVGVRGKIKYLGARQEPGSSNLNLLGRLVDVEGFVVFDGDSVAVTVRLHLGDDNAVVLNKPGDNTNEGKTSKKSETVKLRKSTWRPTITLRQKYTWHYIR